MELLIQVAALVEKALEEQELLVLAVQESLSYDTNSKTKYN
jgi:hypothetical protein